MARPAWDGNVLKTFMHTRRNIFDFALFSFYTTRRRYPLQPLYLYRLLVAMRKGFSFIWYILLFQVRYLAVMELERYACLCQPSNLQYCFSSLDHAYRYSAPFAGPAFIDSCSFLHTIRVASTPAIANDEHHTIWQLRNPSIKLSISFPIHPSMATHIAQPPFWQSLASLH